nr:chemotaxis protein CheB [Pseudomonas sp. dw_358]
MHLPKVIVIGACAGGHEAVTHILHALPADFPAAVLVALHPPAGTTHRAATLWSKPGQLLVRQAEHGVAITAGQAYISPPLRHLEVDGGSRLILSDPIAGLRPVPWVDRLFLSAVAAFGDRVIAVVLTGGDSDGSQGMRAVHDVGGIGIVQEPSDAADPSMPLSSLRIDHPAYCLPLREIAGVLRKLAAQNADSMVI